MNADDASGTALHCEIIRVTASHTTQNAFALLAFEKIVRKFLLRIFIHCYNLKLFV